MNTASPASLTTLTPEALNLRFKNLTVQQMQFLCHLRDLLCDPAQAQCCAEFFSGKTALAAKNCGALVSMPIMPAPAGPLDQPHWKN